MSSRWVRSLGAFISTTEIALPQHPEAPNRRSVLRLRGEVAASLRRSGLAAFEPPLTAGIMTACADGGDSARFLEVGAGHGLHGLLCSALLDPAAVVSARVDDRSLAATRDAALLNDLDIDVVALGDASIDELVTDAGLAPTVLKVELAGSRRLLDGARRTVRRHHPVLFVPFRGGSGGVSASFSKLLRREGYVGYRLGGRPRWAPRQEWTNGPGVAHPYWMLTPGPLDDRFEDRFDWWVEEFAVCTPDPAPPRIDVEFARAMVRNEGVPESLRIVRRMLSDQTKRWVDRSLAQRSTGLSAK